MPGHRGALGGPWCRGEHPPAAGDWRDSKPISSGSFVKRDNERYIRDGEELMSPHHPPPPAARQVSGFGSDSRILSAVKLPARSQAPGVTTGHANGSMEQPLPVGPRSPRVHPAQSSTVCSSFPPSQAIQTSPPFSCPSAAPRRDVLAAGRKVACLG